MEEQLRQIEECYHILMDVTPDPVIVQRDNRFLYCNCLALGLFGATTLEQLQENTFLDLIHSQDREEVRALFEKVLHGERINSQQLMWLRLDGQTVHVEVSAVMVDYQGERAIQLMARDISGRKQMEWERELLHRQLDEERTRFETILRQMPVGVIIVETDSGQLSYHNEAATSIFRRQVDSMLLVAYCSKWKVLLPDGSQIPPEQCPFARAMFRGETLMDEEFAIERGDGTIGFVSVNAAPIRDASDRIVAGVVVFTDITERQRINEALKGSDVSLRLAVLSTDMGTFDYYPLTGRLEWSATAKRHYGLPPDAQGDYQLFLDGVHPDDRERVEQAVRKALVPEHGGEFSTEYRTIGINDGKERWLAARGQAFFDKNGTAVRFIGVCLDITESLKIEKALKEEVTLRLLAMEELRRQEQLLIQQARFAAMGEMIGNIAHQWRQPLNTLGLILQELPMCYEQNLHNRGYLDSSVNKAMQLILHMSQTIDGFRNFFKPDKQKKTFSIREVAEKTVSIMEASFTALKLGVEMNVDEDVTVDGFSNEYSQVILNILMNARDAFVERKVAQPRVVMRIFRAGDKRVLTITDNAGGIPDDIIGKIFDPYFTTKGPDKGTGVGLFMSKLITANMNGTLTVRNTGDGAEFRIEA